MQTIEQYLLTKLAEECMELGQVALKASQFGPNEQRDLPTSNLERMQKEFNDVKGIIELLHQNTNILLEYDQDMVDQKVEKVRKYLKYSQELGMVEEGKLRYAKWDILLGDEVRFTNIPSSMRVQKMRDAGIDKSNDIVFRVISF